ncbi:MAG: NosD domain-containing protein [Methanobacteriota archaeon]
MNKIPYVFVKIFVCTIILCMILPGSMAVARLSASPAGERDDPQYGWLHIITVNGEEITLWHYVYINGEYRYGATVPPGRHTEMIGNFIANENGVPYNVTLSWFCPDHHVYENTSENVLLHVGETVEIWLNGGHFIAPVADAGGPYSGERDAPIQFDASGSYDPHGQIVWYRWDWTNDGIWDTNWFYHSPTASHSYPAHGHYTVKVQVRDEIGLVAVDTAPVTVWTGPTVYIDHDYLYNPPEGFGVDKFEEIQEGIDAVTPGGTVYVYSSESYYHSIVVDKTVHLIALEDRDSTIINGWAQGTAVRITAPRVNMTGFTVQQSGSYGYMYNGIEVRSTGNTLSGNQIRTVAYGISLYYGSNKVTGNYICGTFVDGFYVCSDLNTLWENTVECAGYGIHVPYGAGNRIYHNNFMCGHGLNVYEDSNNNFWDNGAMEKGNYWDDWSGQGVYTIEGPGNGVDHYPFAHQNGWHQPPHGSKKYFACEQGDPE